MKAGRELDALIAEKVMGLTRHDESYVAEGVGKVLRFVWRDGCGGCVYSGDMFLPHYSTNIADAWEVVEKADLWSLYGSIGDGPYRACIQFEDREGLMTADTAPLAICLAALKAVSQEGQG